MDKTLPHEDSGVYGWLVVLACHVIAMFVMGLYQCLGPAFVALQLDFNTGSSSTAWILSVFIFLELGLGPLANVLVKKIGYRWTVILGGSLSSLGLLLTAFAPSLEFMYFSFAVLVGFGYGIILDPHMAIIALYIKKRYVLANSLVVCGSGTGAFLFTPMWQLLIERYGWSGAFLVFAGLNANICVCGMLLKTPMVRPDKRQVKEGVSQSDCMEPPISTEKRTLKRRICDLFDFDLFCQYKTYILFPYVYFLGIGLGFTLLPVHLVERAVYMELGSKRDISYAMSIFGICAMIGRLLPVAVFYFNIRKLSSVKLYGLTFVIAGILNLLSPLATTYTTYCVYVALLALVTGVLFTMFSQVVKDTVGPTKLMAGLSLSSPFGCLGGLLGPPLAGWIYDSTQDYNNAFYFYGSCMSFAGLTILVVEPFTQRCDNKRKEKLARNSDVGSCFLGEVEATSSVNDGVI